jgi:hypothetical protein
MYIYKFGGTNAARDRSQLATGAQNYHCEIEELTMGETD